jgi:energy-coupling factor transporter ATP-binding protein EcfA2
MNKEQAISNINDKMNVKLKFNPFPGLRPFTIDESHLYFGREGQSDEVLHKLADSKFVAVVGASGSGKSSLIYCGLVPILYGGFITSAGANWKIITSRPGNSPIANIANAIAKSNIFDNNETSNTNYHKIVIETILRRSSQGLVEAIKNNDSFGDENILIIVDQFEELFRFKQNLTDETSFNESLAFVSLLVEAVEQSELPIYVVLTMRSDFLGECAQYQQLTTLINKSHYLIPQMTRNDLRKAITGPIAVGRGDISSRLLDILLNDVGDNPDQLPILQHSLMRTWEYWQNFRKEDEPLDLNHYDAIGRMEKALSEHANEAYDELNYRGKIICEHLFKSLTERGLDNRGIRRPTKISEICAIANANFQEVSNVINVFRKPGRSFLSPPVEYELDENTVLDISHESIMRVWDRLRLWVDEEASSVQMYIRLSDAAQMYQEGKVGLWRPPDLHLAVAWKQKQKPTLAWALRYNPFFERTIAYLDASEREFRADEENKIRLQKRTLKRSRNVALVLGAAAIFSLGATIFAFTEQLKAKDKELLARQREEEAEEQRSLAELSFLEAEKQKQVAEKRREEALMQQQLTEEQKLLAEFSAMEAVRQKELAMRKSAEANQQRAIAEVSSKEAFVQKETALSAKEEAFRLRMLSISQSLAVKSQQIKEDDQKALFAYHAFKFNQDYRGSWFNNDIYNGLYFALKTKHPDKFAFVGSCNDAVRSMVFDGKAKMLYSISSDGEINKWNVADKNSNPILLKRDSRASNVISIDKVSTNIAYGKRDGKIELLNLSNSKSTVFEGHRDEVVAIRFVENTDYFISASKDSTIRAWNYKTGSGWTLAICDARLMDVVISSDGKSISAILQNTGVAYWHTSRGLMKNRRLQDIKMLDTENINKIHAIEFDKSGNYLVTGDRQGNVIVWDAKSQRQLFRLRGHTARISNLKFNNDGTILASSSFDGTVRLWQTLDFNNDAIVLKDHESWVHTVEFAADDKTVYTGGADSKIKQWYLEPSVLAQLLKNKLSRNMTQTEWELFVGEDIEYQKALPNLK